MSRPGGLAARLLHGFFRRFFRAGRLDVTYPGGQTRRYGDGTGPALAIRLTDGAAVRGILRNPQLGIGEAYVSERLVVQQGTLGAFLGAMLANGETFRRDPYLRALMAVRTAFATRVILNTAVKSRHNAAHAYDIDEEFFGLFLDDDMQYTCAYYAEPGMTLAEAQRAKQRHIAKKLLLEPGMRVLDVGCGWGGLALTLARDHGVRVTAITLADNQRRVAQARAERAGLADRVEFRWQDYREVAEQFDRVVAIGVLEHVGLRAYWPFFGGLHRVLKPDGVALVHSIMRIATPEPVDPWLTRYMFPGGYIPSVSQVCAAVERQNLWLADLEIWRGHYDRTLQDWHAGFEANIERIARRYGDEFVRMWRYFLVGSEMSFRHQKMCVGHVQLSHRRDAVPPTRAYQYAAGSGRLGHEEG